MMPVEARVKSSYYVRVAIIGVLTVGLYIGPVFVPYPSDCFNEL